MRTLRICLVQLFAICCLYVAAYSQIVGPAGGSTNLAAPGPIGGTTSSTGQFTQICTGASPCTLPGTTGNITTPDNGGTLLWIGPTSQANFGGVMWSAVGQPALATNSGMYSDGSEFYLNAITTAKLHLRNNNNDVITVNGVSANTVGGATFQSTGGSIPTATCSGGSTGVSIAAGSTNNRGSITTSSNASTNCTITWSASGTWNQAPFCVFDDGAASITPTGVSVGACGTSTCVIDFASATSKIFNWICM